MCLVKWKKDRRNRGKERRANRKREIEKEAGGRRRRGDDEGREKRWGEISRGRRNEGRKRREKGKDTGGEKCISKAKSLLVNSEADHSPLLSMRVKHGAILSWKPLS